MGAFHAFAEHWLNFFSLHMIEVSAFVVLIWLLDRYVSLNTGMRYMLWIFALVKTLIPPFISLPEPVQQTIPAEFYIMPAVEVSGAAAPTGPGYWTLVLCIVWICSILLFAGYIVAKNILLRRRLNSAVLLRDVRFDDFEDAGIFETAAIASPLLLSIRSPRLYLPLHWRTWSVRQLKSVIVHEHAHYLHRDIWVLILQKGALVLFGINPLIWFMHARLNHLRENRCDEVAMLKSGVNSIEYSKLLITILEQQKRPLSFIVGKSFSDKDSGIRKRIHHILNFREAAMKKRSVLYAVLSVLLAMLLVPFSWQCAGQKAPLSPEPASQATLSKTNVPAGEQIFVEYDTPPAPVGGFGAIQKSLRYPAIARKAGIEGRVIVQVLISEDGNVLETRIMKSLGDGRCDEAAVAAIRNIAWKPALQGDRPVKVWVAIPVIFRLSDGKSTMEKSLVHQGDFAAAPPVPAPPPGETNINFSVFDTPPTMKNGMKALIDNLYYPEIAKKAGIEGRVMLQVEVRKSGEIGNVKVVKGLGSGCDEAAIAAVRKVQWLPASKKGEAVDCWIMLPVVFKLGLNKAARPPEAPVSPAPVPEQQDRMDDVPPPPPPSSEKAPPPPPPESGEASAIDHAPSPVDGMKALFDKVYYPETAHKAGVEGRVIVSAQVDVDGKVKQTRVIKSIGNSGLDQPVIYALENTSRQPARSGDRLVEAWVTLPVVLKKN